VKLGSGLYHATLLVALLAQGCATLPDINRELAVSHEGPIVFESARGPVSDARSAAILAQLRGEEGESQLLKDHLAYEQAVNADSPLVLGNEVKLLENGPETYAAMFAAIRGARDSINLETYIFDDDEAGNTFSDLLLERQAAGVQVNIIHDSVGSLLTPRAFFDRLRAGGINVLEFNPVNPLEGRRKAWALNNRDHRRQLVIDGRTAFTGGVNISATYSSAPGGKHSRKAGEPPNPRVGWRDTHIKIEGPVVAVFQKLVMASWQRQRGNALAARDYFPQLQARGQQIVRVIGTTPENPQSQIFRTLMSAIAHAQATIHLTVAYFAPDPQLLHALITAAQRGVDVRLVLPSYTDSSPIFHLGRSYYTRLLKGGVKIYQRRGAIMHAKTACIDGVWSTVGSSNLDWRSFLHNDEINAVILGRGFATQMEAMFDSDMRESDAVDLQKWRHRSWTLRLKERMARIAAYWL
jgi:cardiolipin synthase